ncbi:MAG: GerMN domain-containing protein [Acidimicrobiales bacterium]
MRTTRTGHQLVKAVAALAIAAADVAGCGDDDEAVDTSTTTTAETTTSTSDTTDSSSITEPEVVDGVLVYFAWDEAVGAAGRPDVASEPEAAIEALLDGPDDFETDIGMGSEIPDSTELLGVTIGDGTATVDLSGDFESGGGSLSMELRVAQVAFTATQFDDVDTVDIHLDGAPVDAIGGEGVPATDLDRSDFPNVAPAVLVEAPAPGESVTSPLTASGTSDQSGSSVTYNVTDGEGLIVAEGTADVDDDGAFTFTAEFEPVRGGLGAVIVWHEDDAGGQQDVYEVPVRVEAAG